MNPSCFESYPEGGFGWHPPCQPVVTSLCDFGPCRQLSLIEAVGEEWNRQLVGPVAVDVQTHVPRVSPPKAISVPIRHAAIRVRSFAFAESDAAADWRGGAASRDGHPHAHASVGMAPDASMAPDAGMAPDGDMAPGMASGTTRIKPPADVIKLQDRLGYVLQPSLESLMAERHLAMPHEPFPFQLEGIAFLYPRHAAVLADEMGLGKTMQTITAIRLLLHRGEVRSVLIVCPKALVSNWQRELAHWAPEVPLLVVEGDQARRHWQWRLPDVAVRITNYELLCRDRELLEDGAGRERLQFDLVVLDESQRIKNRSSTTSLVTRSIARKRNWALTGTPVENSAEDLVGIFEFLSPGFLSPAWKPRRMGRAVADHVLRRTKDQVLTDLPPKLFRDADLELSPQQRETYEMAEEQGVLRLTEMGDSATIQHVFELVLRLKQICNFDPATQASSKLEQLRADMEEIAGSGRKAIVFSQWVGTLRKLAGRLRRFGPLEYHGQIPSSRRDAVIRQFREDRNSHVLLMSYGAGGVGLNLQFAHYVFLFDRWWNPAVEDQATARAHRIGASGPITVTRFLVRDSIEERIDRVLEEKRELFDTIFSGGRAPTNLGFSRDDLFGLFQLEGTSRTHHRAA